MARKWNATPDAAAAAILGIVLVTIGAELWPDLEAVLAGLTGHHWLSKSLLGLLVFVGAGFIRPASTVTAAALKRCVRISISAGVGLFLFFLLHALHVL